MFHEDICTFPTVNIYKTFLISNMYCYELRLDNFKGDFLNILIYLHPQIIEFQIVVSLSNIVL